MKARIYRLAKEKEEAKSKFKRSGMIRDKRMSKMHLVHGIEDEDYEYMTYMNYVNTKNSLQERIQKKLDLILKGKKAEALDDGVSV